MARHLCVKLGFEGTRKRLIAQKGLATLEKYADTVITLSNDRMLQLTEEGVGPHQAFITVDDMVCRGIESIWEMIAKPGLISLDLADVRSIMTKGGIALMAIGEASGQGRAKLAALKALGSPLLETSIENAKNILFNVTGGADLTLYEVNEVAQVLKNKIRPKGEMVFGAVVDERMTATIRVTVIQYFSRFYKAVYTVDHFTAETLRAQRFVYFFSASSAPLR